MRKYELIEHEEGQHAVTFMCRLLKVHRAGFYAWKQRRHAAPDARKIRRQELSDLIGKIWIDHHKILGVRRIHAELAAQGMTVSPWLVWQLMRELGIQGIQPRATKRTTIPAPDAGIRRDFIGRRFTPPVPTTCLVGDITYLKTGEGWLYLATVIDLTTRMVVGWQTAAHMRTSLVVDALTMAHRAGYTAGNAIFHSDKGAQGGFNWLSQHPDPGGVQQWQLKTGSRKRAMCPRILVGSGARIGRYGPRCDRPGDLTHPVQCNASSGV